MTKEFTIHNVPYNHLYADLSYAEFFSRYYPQRDGRVYAATYSFDHKTMDFWWRLAPTSTIYIDNNYATQAKTFLRRFPLFEIYSVQGLHTKAVFFEHSGVLLVGSENIYKPKSSFSEVMLETYIPEDKRQQVIELVFRRLKGELLTCQYSVNDIHIHSGDDFSGGRPFLPCHREVPYWDLIGSAWLDRNLPSAKSNVLPDRATPRMFHRWIYHVQKYNYNGKIVALAFDRGYTYCGDLDESAFNWLIDNCVITESHSGSGPIASGENTMIKDQFYRYHPFANDLIPEMDYWIGPVKDRSIHRKLEVILPTE